jgi:hypothetical protein
LHACCILSHGDIKLLKGRRQKCQNELKYRIQNRSRRIESDERKKVINWKTQL